RREPRSKIRACLIPIIHGEYLRKEREMLNKTTKRLVYLAAALAMLVYAIPRLPVGGGWTLPALFSAAWILFALVIVASHLYAILRVDEETEERMERIRKHRKRELTSLIERSVVRRGGN